MTVRYVCIARQNAIHSLNLAALARQGLAKAKAEGNAPDIRGYRSAHGYCLFTAHRWNREAGRHAYHNGRHSHPTPAVVVP